MRIWLQSGSGLSADAGAQYGRLYEAALARRFEVIARPGTELATFGIDETPFGKDRYHAAKHMVVTGVIKSALRAEVEGYDAVGVINTFDHGYYELRELLGIPVVFITESTLYLACQLAQSFAVIGHNNQIRLQVEELGRRYGLSSRMVVGDSLDIGYEEFSTMYDDPPAYLERFGEAARNAIGRGAGALVVVGNPLNMFLVDQGLTIVEGVPLVDGLAATVKTAETLVDLRAAGIERGKTGLFATPDDDDLEKLRALFQ